MFTRFTPALRERVRWALIGWSCLLIQVKTARGEFQ